MRERQARGLAPTPEEAVVRPHSAALGGRLLTALDVMGSEMLFLLDELFHGTNSSDRLDGAHGVLRLLMSLRAIGLITTHDLALAALADRLAPAAANVHFEDQLAGGAMTFDYRLRPGRSTGTNALALMAAVGLEVSG